MAARKTSALPTRVWSFPCRVDDPQALADITFAARKYYNVLVAIERARVERFREIRRRYAPRLADAEERIIEIDAQIESLIRDTKRARQAHWRETGERSRVTSATYEATMRQLRGERKVASDEAKLHRSAFLLLLADAQAEHRRRSTERAAGGGPKVKSRTNAETLTEMLDEPQWSGAWKEIARSDERAHAESLAARASCGLATGTYLQVEDAFLRAKRDSSPLPPRFRRYDGEGKIAVQLRDVLMSDILTSGVRAMGMHQAPRVDGMRGDQSRVYIVDIDQSAPRGDRRTMRCTAVLHRLPPMDASIKWASVVTRRVGRRTMYRLQLTLEHESFAKSKRPAGVRKSEHLRIGWAAVEGGVRVAHWPGGDVVVPSSILDQHEHAAHIESVADTRFERAKRLLRLVTKMAGHDLTAWHLMRSDRARAQVRMWCMQYALFIFGDDLQRMWSDWRRERKSRGEDLYVEAWVARKLLRHEAPERALGWWLYVWAKKDEHMMQLVADSRRRFTNRRDYFFRREAIRLATEFEALTVDKYKIAPLRELPSLAMSGDEPRDHAQHNATAAAPGRFREILLEVMGSRCEPCERPRDGQDADAARYAESPENSSPTAASSCNSPATERADRKSFRKSPTSVVS